jgi:hypothetical protein
MMAQVEFEDNPISSQDSVANSPGFISLTRPMVGIDLEQPRLPKMVDTVGISQKICAPICRLLLRSAM